MRPLPSHRNLSLLTILLAGAVTAYTNRTIDDTLGDSVTRANVTYTPSFPGNSVWKLLAPCDCTSPDLTQTFDGTWTGATYDPSYGSMAATFQFEGTAVYIFFVQSNYPKSTGLAQICDFLIDDEIVGHCDHTSDGSSTFQYQALAYKNTSLVNGFHIFQIKTTGQNVSFLIFDYAVYTTGDGDSSSSSSNTSSTTSSTSTPASAPSSNSASSSASNDGTKKRTPIGAIVGGVIGGIAAIAFFILALALCRRRDRVQYAPFVPFTRGRRANSAVNLAGDSPPMIDLQHQITERRHAVDKLERNRQLLDRNGGGPDGSDVMRQIEEIRTQIGRMEAQQQLRWESANAESTGGPSVASDSGLRMNSNSGLLELPPSYAPE